MYKGGQRWDEKEARHFMHMHRYLSDIFEVGNLILLEYKKRILGGPFIKTVKLHYPEKDMMFEVDANIAHPSSRPRMYYLAGLNGSGYNSTFELAPERVLLPAECYACQVEVNHKLRQGESWMAWDGPRSSGTPYLLKVRNNGMATGERAVTGPVIIVNLDSYRAFAYLEGEIPYLLDDNERAFIVSLRMSINRLSKSMNDRLPKMFYDIEHDRKLTPQGKRYHLTEGEKIYIILHGDEELTKRMSRKPIGDNRFGYDDTTWNNIIEKEDKVNAFIKALNAERDTKTDKPIIRVEECGDGNFRLTRNMSKRDATLFVYLISCILGIWDFSNHDDHVAPPVVDHDLSACDRGFDNNNSMCSSYFDVRLSLPKDTIRKNRKYAMRCFDEERKGLAGDVLSDRVKNIFDLVKKAAVKMI